MRAAQLAALGAAGFAASAYGGYVYATRVKALEQARRGGGGGDDGGDDGGGGSGGGGAGSRGSGAATGGGGGAFDRLAPLYDAVVGAEERVMLYGPLRWWLLRGARGDVLEISAGTGRNLSAYDLSRVTSLTLADVSAAMLRVAQRKYFDELRLQYAAPDTSVRFLLADAQRMVAAAPGEAPRTVLVPRAADDEAADGGGRSVGRDSDEEEERGSSGSSGSGSSGSSEGVWRFRHKGRRRRDQEQQPAGAAGGGAEAPAAAAATAPEAVAAANPPAPGKRRQPGGDGGGSSSRTCGCRDHHHNNQQQHQQPRPLQPQQQLSTFAPRSFDVVVDTFGLCSCDDPVAALRQAALLVKPGGKLLLLEHGRSTWRWLNDHMDARAQAHHDTYGCWYNRDIEQIVRDAGLEPASASRWHFGTTYVVEVVVPAADAAGAAG